MADYLEVLDREVRKVAKQGVKILELGCFNGASSVLLHKIAKENKGFLHCIDDVFRPGFFNRMDSISYPYLTSKGKTKEWLPGIRDDNFDVVFIDAGHTYNEVSFDLEQAKRLLRPGGLLIGDDLNSHVELNANDWMPFFIFHQDEYGTKVDGIPGTIYAGVFLAVKEFCAKYSFTIEREENLYWGTV